MLTLSNGKTASEKTIAPPIKRKRSTRWWIYAIVAAVVAVSVAAVWILLHRSAAVTYETTAAVTQDLTQSVTASGTVNAQNTVLVGTQVSGTIQTIYVDYNSRVRQGEVLARLDPSQFQAQLAQSQSALSQARAQWSAASQNASAARFSTNAAGAVVLSANAEVDKARSALALAQRTLQRDKQLLAHGYISQSQYDSDYANALAAQAALRAAAATVTQSTAQNLQSGAGALGQVSAADAAAAAVQAAQASVQQAQLNLSRTVITSPVDGTVVARNVSVGQTVAASFQTPTLFTIAQDLKKMEVDIAVGEPDIGNVRPGANVSFSVLAYPNQTFRGKVSQVRVNPTTVQNVVTYTVIVLVDNSSGKLLPGMTANASIAVATAKRALTVPLQALSYRPSTYAGPRRSPRPFASAAPGGAASPWGQTGSGAAGAVVAGSRGLLFALRDGKPQAVAVRIDLVSGMQAAVTPLRGSLKAGDDVIVGGSNARAPRTAGQTNPAAGFGRMVR